MIKRVDSGGQVHLVTNIRKPRKWRRFEYLLSNGQAYIDTKIPYDSTKSTYKIECKFSLPSNVGSYDAIFGAYTDENSKTLRIIRGNNNSIMWSYYNTRAGGGVCGTMQTANSNIREVVLTSTKTVVTENGTTTTYTHPAVNGNNTTSKFYLFCQGISNGSISCLSKSRIYYFKLYDNDILIKHFVPAQYNGQYGMWDLVEDRFYPNKGTGTFTVGPEIKNYDEIYEVRKTTSLLPSGVELYDYILSNGTLYIDTGWITDYTKSFEIISKYNASSAGSRGCILSSYKADRAISLEVTPNSRFWLHGGNIDNSITANVGVDHISIFNYGGGTWKHQVDGGTALTGSASYSDSAAGSAFMFLDRALRTTTFNRIFKMYYLSIKENGVLIRNFLPCTYLGEPGMWDTVENKFYRNQGTGLFTLGNKITLKEYEYLKTVSTGQSIDTGILLTDNHSVAYDIIFKYENNGVRRLMGPSGSSGSYFGANSNGKYDRYSSISIGNIDHLYEEFNLITKKLVAYINDFKYRENSITAANSIGHCYIFSLNGINNYTGAGQYFYSGKMVYDGKVIRDFIPVSYNGTPGLWDKVEWKFYGNAGSGNFTLGPEKNNGIYPVILRIEYLLGNGTSTYIDSGINPKIKPRVVAYISIINNADKDYWGNNAKDGSAYYADFNLAKLMYYRYGTITAVAVNYTATLNTWHIWDISKEVYVDGDLKYTSPNTYTYDSSLSTILIFKAARSNYYSAYQLGWLKIYDGDILVRDFVPVRFGTVGALYDLIEGKVYFNSGTGNFILGPDINL